MAKNVVIGLLASLLIAVVCAGAIIAVVHSTNKAKSESSQDALSTSSKSVSQMCSPALYKESCERTLSQLSANGSVSETEIFKTFVELTLKEFENAARRSAEVAKDKPAGANSTTDAAVSDCKRLLDDALEHTKGVASLAGQDIANLTAESDNIAQMITTSMTYMYTCVDGFEDPELSKKMDTVLKNATEMSSNVLGVITSIAQVLETLETNLGMLQTNGTSRRLLGYDLDHEGYPTWLNAGDRRLLQAASVTPNVVVAKDGSGDFKTINDAIKNMPAKNEGKYVIYVKSGVYEEIVKVPKGKNNVFMYGDGQDKTIVSGHISNVQNRVTTMLTATFTVEASNFTGQNMGFRNTAGAINHQAVAFRISAESGAFFKCRFDGFQDTLYAHTGTQFFRDCTVSGTIDFIFGNSAAVFQNCLIIVNRPLDNQQNTVTAHGRTDPNMKTGHVLQNCQIVADKALEPDRVKIPSYLGRPWKEYSRAIIMESSIGDVIRPEGWMAWAGEFGLKTLYFAEYGNTGAGAATAQRVKWPGFHVITKNVAAQFTAGPFINANNWLAATGIPTTVGFTK